MKRGEVWLIDLGLAAKARPAVILSVPFQDNKKAVVTYVARSLQWRGGRFEVDHQSPRFRPGVFDAQNIGTVPTAKLIRRLADLPADKFGRGRGGITPLARVREERFATPVEMADFCILFTPLGTD
jgi:mRNA interferase MazF